MATDIIMPSARGGIIGIGLEVEWDVRGSNDTTAPVNARQPMGSAINKYS
jgi:hypothetical protein